MDRQFHATCLSGKPHNNRVSDVTVHYTGCLRVSQRKAFLNSLPPESQRRILFQQQKTKRLRSQLETVYHTSTAAQKLRDFKAARSEWCYARGRPQPAQWLDELEGRATSPPTTDEVDAHIKASVVFFKDAQPFNVPKLSNSFPHQKITVEKLLADDPVNNPIMQPCEEDMVRYFHLPANNMIWIEVRTTQLPLCRPPSPREKHNAPRPQKDHP